MIRFRRLTHDDVEQVRSVALHSWKFTYRRIYSATTIKQRVSSYYSYRSFERLLPHIQKGDEWFYVSLDGNQVVGFSHLGRGKHGWELVRIYLLPEYTRQGIGTKLLRLGEAFLKRKKISRYLVYALPRNRSGIEFYLKKGFTRAPTMDTRMEVCLERKLRPR